MGELDFWVTILLIELVWIAAMGVQWIRLEIEAAQLRRMVPPYQGVANLSPPTVAELDTPDWVNGT